MAQNFNSSESAFNFALEYLKQISESLKMCSLYSSQDDIFNWTKWLRNCYRQLSVKLEKDEEKNIIGDYSQKLNIEEVINNVEREKHSTFRVIYALSSPEYLKRGKNISLFLLDALEVKIRQKLQEKGMLLPSKADPRFAILER